MTPPAVIACVVLVGITALALGTAAAVVVARLSDRVADRLGLPRAPERCPMCGAVERCRRGSQRPRAGEADGAARRGGRMTLHDQLRAAGYTSRLPTDADRREHRASSLYARAILDSEGRCVALLAAHEAWAWLRGER